jgi:hypothetical protein
MDLIEIKAKVGLKIKPRYHAKQKVIVEPQASSRGYKPPASTINSYFRTPAYVRQQ